MLTRCRVIGKANIPHQGSLLVIANHLHLVDPPILATILNRKAICMAKEELFRSWFTGYFISRFGAFAVRRGQPDRQAIQQAEKVLTRGWVLIMFPEATRSPDAQMQDAFHGAALIARRNNVPILPIGITGTEKIKGFTWLFQRLQITVNIGRPFDLPPDDGQVSRSDLTQLTDFMMVKVAALIPNEYRGKYQEKGRLDDAKG
jgi:1-acyl-sn-glycerol-3-phosphate acyltransferase